MIIQIKKEGLKEIKIETWLKGFITGVAASLTVLIYAGIVNLII